MNYWKRKLAAYLHDPPHKPVGIQDHERQRQSFLNRFGLDEEIMKEFDRSSDWQAAAADRLIFPDPAKSGLRVDWKASWLEFRHPLGGGVLKPTKFPPTAAQTEAVLTRALEAAAIADSDDWRHKFIAGWRLWPELAAREQNPHFAYLVADTRIPDHTLWHHNALAAAFSACEGRPAFLLFQIGPVQDFIAQARKTQDLWSGSYLLSFLIAQAMLAVAHEVGPDAVVFPQMRGLPLADWWWSERGYFGELRLRASRANELLTPNLPNRFLALVPAGDRGAELARAAEKAVCETWRRIAESVRLFIDVRVSGQCPRWDDLWESQVARFPIMDWFVHEWPRSSEALEQAAQGSPPLHGGWEAHPLHMAKRWAEEFIPAGHRERYGPRSNAGFAWALHFAGTDWKFAACKNARSFGAWADAGNASPNGVPKDHLDGRNEALGGENHEQFRELLNDEGKFHREFKGRQLYGAISLIKRLWPRCYLHETLGWDDWRPRFESVPDLVAIEHAIDREEGEVPDQSEPKYYAILFMDGDDMGQWVSGAKAAPLVNSLAKEAESYFRQHWQAGPDLPPADQVKRPLSPGYHAALSEALANFSLYCAGPIVREFSGQLLYAGGDDVVAMLPARNALECAQALQLAFRGIDPAEVHASVRVREKLEGLFDYSRHVVGFLTLRRTERGDVGRAGHLKPNWPLMVMGPSATMSAGISIGHVRAPMQDTVQAAREAERAVKNRPGKGAFCLRVLKRSGEAAQFVASFESAVAGVWAELQADEDQLSGRFPYRFLQLTSPLLTRSGRESDGGWERAWTSDLLDAVEAELRHVHYQQNESGSSSAEKRDRARTQAARWIRALVGDRNDAGTLSSKPALTPRDFAHFWMAWAFVRRINGHRTRGLTDESCLDRTN